MSNNKEDIKAKLEQRKRYCKLSKINRCLEYNSHQVN